MSGVYVTNILLGIVIFILWDIRSKYARTIWDSIFSQDLDGISRYDKNIIRKHFGLSARDASGNDIEEE